MTAQEVADATGQHPETVRKHARQDGAPHTRGRRNQIFFDLAEYEHWRSETKRSGKPGRPGKPTNADIDAARLRKEFALAAKYELQVEKERGRLIDKSELDRIVVELATTERNKFKGFAASIAPQLVGLEGGEIEHRLSNAIRSMFQFTNETTTPE